MAITSRTATVGENASTQTIDGVLPTDRVSGDVVVATFVMAGTTGQITGPSGWTSLAPATFGNDNNTLSAWYRFDPPGVPTCTTAATANRASVICQAYGGVNSTTPLDVTTATSATAPYGASLAVGGITIATAGARLISGCVVDSSSATFTAAPSGMTMVGDASGGGVGRGMAVADEVRSSTGATGTRTWSQSGSNGMVAYLAALRPRVDAAVTPAAVAAVAAVPVPVLATGSTVAPPVVAVVAAVPAVVVSVSATVTPGVVAATVAVPTPAVSTGTNASVTPAAVEATTAVPAPSVGAGSGVAPAAVAAVAAVPVPVLATGAAVSPAAVAAVAGVPAVAVSTGTQVLPAVVAAVAAVPVPVVATGATVLPAPVEAATAVPVPVLSTGATVAAAVAAAVAGVPVPSLGGSANVAAAVVEVVTAVPAVVVGAGAGVSPSTVQAVAAIPAPRVRVPGRGSASIGTGLISAAVIGHTGAPSAQIG